MNTQTAEGNVSYNSGFDVSIIMTVLIVITKRSSDTISWSSIIITILIVITKRSSDR